MEHTFRPIRDYSIIGNLRSAALVSKDGSIDWAPAPFIDSPSVFAALLDSKKGGCWQIAPDGSFTSSQEYVRHTNVLVTSFKTRTGSLSVTDFIPLEKEKTYLPPEEDTTFKIKRKVECKKGSCRVSILFNPRFDYGRGATTIEPIERGLMISHRRTKAVLVGETDFQISGEGARATVELSEGESMFLVFRYNMSEIVHEKDDSTHHEEELRETISFWRGWSRKCDVEHCAPVGGIWRDVVLRSALVLKILFFEPVGTVAAAATTSLPEEIGGVRNWDYRFTWLRDASFIFQAMFHLGHATEAKEYIHWLVKQCDMASDPSKIQIMYGLKGEEKLMEEVLPHLSGYKNSRPVRIGNGAYSQKQWDIYGSILDMVWSLHELTGDDPLDEESYEALCRVADYVCNIWRLPDEGLWEVRGGKAHFVYSKVMCWVALDRITRLTEAYGFKRDTARWQTEKEAIYRDVCKKGWDAKRRCFVQKYGSSSLDAALLLLSRVGFVEGDDPRMLSTIDAIKTHLCFDGTYVYRYTAEDGLPGREGAFLLASFWLVDALCRAGRVDEGRQLFERLLSGANHTGLFSEEINPKTGEFLGNFPQGYTHVGLINSAVLLSEVGAKRA